jgi:nitrogen fixation protein
LIADQPKFDNTGKVTDHAYTSTIIYLPDKTRQYVVKVKQGWGTVNGSVKLADGWRLDTLGAQTDSKGPETITALTGLLKEAGGLAIKSNEQPQAGLYLIEIGTDGTVKLKRQLDWKAD